MSDKVMITPEYCQNWIGDERCGKPAEVIVWGKLFDPDALGPRCYDCAASQIGHNALRSNDHISYAVYRLPALDQPPAEESSGGLTEHDRQRLAGIATNIEGLIWEGNVHPDFAARDVHFLRKLAEDTGSSGGLREWLTSDEAVEIATRAAFVPPIADVRKEDMLAALTALAAHWRTDR